MPTISFDTIEHSDVTGKETTKNEYVIDNDDPSYPTVLYYIDGIWQETHTGKYATELIDTLIHEKTSTKKTTTKATKREVADTKPTDRRRPHLVCSDRSGEGKNESEYAVQAKLFE